MDDAMRLFSGQFKTLDEATREELIDHIKQWEAISKETVTFVGKLVSESAALHEIVRAVASVPDADYDEACPFCKSSPGYLPIEHTPDCPVTKARALLSGE